LRQKQAEAAALNSNSPAVAPSKENVESLLRVEPLAIEVGLGLVKFVDGGGSSPLLKRIAGLRRQIATELGYIVPPVRVTDNLQLRAREYVISLKGIELSRYELAAGCELAIQTGTKPLSIEGTTTREPAFGIPAVWVPGNAIDRARVSGCTVVDPLSVLTTHFGELIRSYAHELFSRQDAKKLLDRVSEENSKLVEDLVPKLLPLSAVQKVLQNLLRERVSIRDGGSILEALGEAAHITKNTILLTEYVRQSIRRMVVKPYLNTNGELPAYFFDAQIEGAVEASAEHSENISHLTLSPQRMRDIVEAMHRTVGSPETPVVALTSSGSRFFLRQICENGIRNLYVLSHTEVPQGVKVLSLGVIR
jgi:flagellar biosynthesis protein FlhA